MAIDTSKATLRKGWTKPALPNVLAIQSGQSVMVRAANGTLHNRICLSMKAPKDPKVTHWEYQIAEANGGVWQATNTVPAVAGPLFINNVEVNTYQIRIRSRRDDGITSPYLVLTAVITGKTTAPPAVPMFFVMPGRTHVTWYYDQDHGVSVPTDLAGFELRYNLGVSKDWHKATVLVPLTNQRTADLSLIPQGMQCTVMICAVDTYGNRSAPKAIKVTMAAELLLNPLPALVLSSPLSAPVLETGFWPTYAVLTFSFEIPSGETQISADVIADHWKLEYADVAGVWHPFPGGFVATQPTEIKVTCAASAKTQAIINSISWIVGTPPTAKLTQHEDS